MKKYLLLLACVIAFPLYANELDEVVIPNKDNTCQMRYLSQKSKNLWTIDVQPSSCRDGWVEGFATVSLKDSLERLVETLHGYFYNGYWFLEFPGEIKSFQRSSPQKNIQSFIFPIQQEDNLELIYYGVARTERPENGAYSAFHLCSKKPVFLVAHDPVHDFQQSVFESAVLKNAQKTLKQICPEATNFELFGVSTKNPNDNAWFFHAQIDSKKNENIVQYKTATNTNTSMPRPTELRHEDGEHLLTVKPDSERIKVSYGDTPMPEPPTKTIIIPATEPLKSAVDLVLLARTKTTDVRGRAVIHINTTQLNETTQIDLPTPLIGKGLPDLKPGWYIVGGLFRYENNQDVIQILSAKNCLKEWCEDEK